MQIGEFAKICNTKISVLRHYDAEGLLPPDYIDRFTGYRYYSKEQITDFLKISMLKSAGFSLAEIKLIITERKSNKVIMELFDKKREKLDETLSHLDQAKKIILGVESFLEINITEADNKILFETEKIDARNIEDAYDFMDQSIASEGFQRISSFTIHADKEKKVKITCEAVKLTEEEIVLNENIHVPFENDNTIIGKWEIIGEFAVKEDFERIGKEKEQDIRSIYFLPGGERYWCYGWSKGKLIIDSGDSATVNDFSTENINGQHYMFVNLKSYPYRHGGRTTVLVLKQTDNKAYTATEIARRDNIDMPFIDDPGVIGKWKAIDFCKAKKDFHAEKTNDKEYFFSKVEFKPNGEIISCYNYGKERIASREMQEWTKGFVLRKWNSTACAYEINNINGKQYLIMEWKSGDYRWGGFDTDYYVFIKE